MALGQAFQDVRGNEFLSPSVQAFRDAAKGLIDPQERLTQFIDNNYIRALMSGDDDAVIAGIRVNLSGRKEGDGISATARYVRAMLNQIMVDAAMDSLEEVRARMAELEQEMDAMALEMFGEEAGMLPGETREEWLTRMNKLAKEKLESGEITQEEYDQWMALQDEWKDLDKKAKAIEARLRKEYQEQQAIIAELGEERTELLSIKDEVKAIKAMDDPAQQDATIAVLVSNYPQYDFDVNGDGVVTADEVEEVVETEIKANEQGIVAAETKLQAISQGGVSDLHGEPLEAGEQELAAMEELGFGVSDVDIIVSEPEKPAVAPVGMGFPIPE